MYKSPIEIIYSGLQTQLEGEVMRAVQSVGVNVDKDELLKALEYDRQQYEKGYADAKEECQRPTGRWEQATGFWDDDCLWKCSACGCEWCFIEGTPAENGTNYCPNCGAKMMEG